METYQYVQPSSALAPFVKNYWFLKTDRITGDFQRVIPMGSCCMFFHRGGNMFSLTENRFQPAAFLAGQTTGYADLTQTTAIDMICVTFQSHAAKAFWGVPVNEFSDRNIALQDLSDPLLTELNNRLMDTEGIYPCVELIEAFLYRRLNISKLYNYDRMWEVIRSINSGESNMKALAGVSCLGYKQFKRIFTEYVGANPKEFLRIVRFHKALFVLEQQPEISFTQLAYACGYYDQSHLNKEFKSFSGYNPGEYLAVCAPHSDYFA